MTPSTLDRLLDRVAGGDALTADEITDLSVQHDILALGMLADAARRRLHGSNVTFLRVAACDLHGSFADAVPPAAREIRITGRPETLEAALEAVASARAIAGTRTVSGFAWSDLQSACGAAIPIGDALRDLRSAGLDAVADLPLDDAGAAGEAVEALTRAGFVQLRVAIQSAPGAERTALFLKASALQAQWGSLAVINPLPSVLQTFRPTTGYEDVRAVAVARLAAPNVRTVQVDWLRYGPKLAQVALTFGADDLDGVTALDEAPEGRRRAPLEEVRRSIESAGGIPVERDGRFQVIA